MCDKISMVFLKSVIVFIILGNITILSYVFLYPRVSFMVSHWGASEREILLSAGPRDNPNMEHLRKIYKLIYFVKDHSEEDSRIYFINPHFSESEAYKILLPRKVHFLDSQGINKLSLLSRKRRVAARYVIFRKKDTPDFCKEDGILWDESGWGIYKCDNL